MRINASDVRFFIDGQVEPINLLINPLARHLNPVDLISDEFDIITYLEVDHRLNKQLDDDVLMIEYDGSTLIVELIDYAEEFHEKHSDSILGHDVKTTLRFKVLAIEKNKT